MAHLERIDLTGVNDFRGRGCCWPLSGWPELATCGRPVTWQLHVTADDGTVLRGPGHCDDHARAAVARAEPDEPGRWHWVGT